MNLKLKKEGKNTLTNSKQGRGFYTRQSKKGFTLIELLAVIVILAVIALIATPIIMNVINESKQGASKDTVYNYIKSVELAVSSQELKGEMLIGAYDINTKGNLVKDGTEIALEMKGNKLTNGRVGILAGGHIGISTVIDNKCYIKSPLSQTVDMLKTTDCKKEIATNLVRNGYLEYEDKTNFSHALFQYMSDDKSLKLTNAAYALYGEDDFIKIDPDRTYRLSMDVRSIDTNVDYYLGITSYDEDKRWIHPKYVMFIHGSMTELAKDLKDGDTIVYLENTNKFQVSSTTPERQLGLIFWNYKNSGGYQYPVETYSRNSYEALYTYDQVNKANNTITLKSPWNHGTIKAGTKLSQSDSGGNNYCAHIGKTPLTWKSYSCSKISGFGMTRTKFFPGTSYVKVLMASNPGTDTYYKNIVFEEISE